MTQQKASQPRQWSAAGTPSLPHTVTDPVTGPSRARSRVAVSIGSVPAAARKFCRPLRRLADRQQRQWPSRRRHPAGRDPACAPPGGARHRGVALELDAVGSWSQGSGANLNQQVGAYLGLARQVDLASPTGDNGHSLPGEAAPPAGSPRRRGAARALYTSGPGRPRGGCG